MRSIKFLLLLLLINSCKEKKLNGPIISKPVARPAPSPLQKDYPTVIKDISAEKKLNRQRWPELLKTEKEKLFTETVCNSIVPYWYGTHWSFNGMSEIPGKGSIACGYFVTTILRDAGVPLKRIKLAQSASQIIIQSLAGNEYINRFSNWPIEKFVAYIHQKGYGLYIVGLDCHVGFIYNDGNEVYFIHANYAGKREVLKEKAMESLVLRSSKYRIAGKISADENLLNKWVMAQ